jgi:TATA-box binding protein (TBP) (component of TFIID and TFIIIB)
MGYSLPTPFRISTITTTASVGAELNLQVLYDNLDIKKECESTGITYVEYGNRKQDTVYKGFAKKFLINRRRQKPAKRFDNQLTIAYRISDETIVNIKVFRNGKIQMTGIKEVGQGQVMVERIVGIVREIHDSKNNEVLTSPDELEKLVARDYKVCLINTDYKVGFEVKRDNLYKVMISDYDNICSYEPCIYPGVKIQYFWNSESPEKDGVCRCSSPCYYKKKSGEGCGDCNCKKITAATFASGATIITGSHTVDQVRECYSYINKILYENVSKIEKKQLVMPSKA